MKQWPADKVERKAVSSLVPYARNARTHSDEQVAQIAASRRTFATVAMEAGILEGIAGRLLSHTPLSITGQRYARPSLDALRPAMQVICDALEKRIEKSTTQAAAWRCFAPMTSVLSLMVMLRS